MAHSSGLNDARDIATSNLIAAAPDLARALLDARAEHAASLIRINAEAVEAVAQARADAQAAVALALEEAAENKEQLEIWAHEILVGLAFADVLKIDSYNDKIEAHDMVGRRLVEVIRALAPADGLAAVEALRVEARENAMQALASMGQAQEAYEAQLEAEAELDRVKADAVAALAAKGLRPDAAEILAKEMQMIVAADRWKGRDLHSAPPEKWHKLRPETQQFWIDTATRILAALEATPEALAASPEVAALIAEARREAEEMTDGLVKASAWVSVAAEVLAGYNRDLGVDLPDTTEIGRIYESRDTPSFRITVGHIRILAAAIRALKETTHD
jgi:hypothetical protein